MNKRLFVLLPAVMLMLAGCGETSESTDTTPTITPTTESTTESTTEPVVENSVKTAYEAGVALATGKNTTDPSTFEGVVSATCGNSFFVQDGDYGMYVYAGKTNYNVAVGKKVKVVATICDYSTLIETKSVTSVELLGDGTAVAAKTVSSAADVSALKQNVLVDFVITLPSDAGTWSGSAAPIVKATLGSDTINVKFDKYGFTEEMGAIYAANAGKKIKVTGAITTAYKSEASDKAPNQLLVVGSTVLEAVAE